MALISQALVKIVGDESNAVASIKRFNAAAEASEKKFNQDFGKVAGYARNVGFAIAAAGTIAAAGLALVIHKAADAQVVWQRLEAQVSNSGRSWDSVRGNVEALSKSVQASTRFDDETVADTLQILISRNGSYAKSIGLVKLTLDTAIGTHKDYAEAAELVGRASSGNMKAFKSLGISADSVEDGMRKLQTRMNGLAEQDGKTLEAQLLRIKGAADNVFEALGGALQGDDGAKSIGGIADAIQRLADTIDKNKAGIHDFFADLTTGVSLGAKAGLKLDGLLGAAGFLPVLPGGSDIMQRQAQVLGNMGGGRRTTQPEFAGGRPAGLADPFASAGTGSFTFGMGSAMLSARTREGFVNPNADALNKKYGFGLSTVDPAAEARAKALAEAFKKMSDEQATAKLEQFLSLGVSGADSRGFLKINPTRDSLPGLYAANAKRGLIDTSSILESDRRKLGFRIGALDADGDPTTMGGVVSAAEFKRLADERARKQLEALGINGVSVGKNKGGVLDPNFREPLTTRDYLNAGAQGAQLLAGFATGRTSAAGAASGALGIAGGLTSGPAGIALSAASGVISLAESIFGNKAEQKQRAYEAHLRAIQEANRQSQMVFQIVLPNGVINPHDPDWKEAVSSTITAIDSTRTGRVEVIGGGR